MSPNKAVNTHGNPAEMNSSLSWSDLYWTYSFKEWFWTEHEATVTSSCDDQYAEATLPTNEIDYHTGAVESSFLYRRSRGYILDNHNTIESLESSKPTSSSGSEKNAELGSLCFNDQNPKYSLIYLYTSNACKTAKELRSFLHSSRFFRLYDVLTIFPVENGIWELLVSNICRFRRCAQELNFAVESCGDPRRGLFARLVILWLCSGENLLMQEAGAHYRNLLKRYSFRDVIVDMATAFFQLPKSTVMGYLSYRMEGLRYVRDIDRGSGTRNTPTGLSPTRQSFL